MESFAKVINSLWGMYMVGDPGGLRLEDPRVAPDYTSMPSPWGDNGLIGMDRPYHGTIVTGTKYGPVRISIEQHEEAPRVELDGWTDVVEVPFVLVDDTAYFTDWDGGAFYGVSAQPGTYRVRVHARGRDAGQAQSFKPDDPPVEVHLVQFFPGDGDEVSYKTEDRFGGCLRGELVPDSLPVRERP